MKKIELTRGYSCTVDDDDYTWIAKHKCCVNMCGSLGAYPYAIRSRDRKRLHRLIVGASKGDVVDHINGNTLDNRKVNLRVCSTRENVRNSRSQSQSRSRFKGVNYYRPGKWSVRIWAHGKNQYLGIYEREEEAALMYNLAAIKFYGKYAYLNNLL